MSNTLIELNTSGYSNEDVEILIAELITLNVDSFEETSSSLKCYIDANTYSLTPLQNFIDSENLQVITQEELPDINWNSEWEKNFDPVFVDNCVVHASFHEIDSPYEYEVLINPKMSFGTGHHATTSLMIKYLLELPIKNKTLLDMGCGTGVLAILGKMKGAARVIGIDNDSWCFENSTENVELNQVDVGIRLGDAGKLGNEEFDIILANINRNILLQDMDKYRAVLNASGTILFSGFYTEDLPLIQRKAQELGLKFVDLKEKNNWIAARFIV